MAALLVWVGIFRPDLHGLSPSTRQTVAVHGGSLDGGSLDGGAVDGRGEMIDLLASRYFRAVDESALSSLDV